MRRREFHGRYEHSGGFPRPTGRRDGSRIWTRNRGSRKDARGTERRSVGVHGGDAGHRTRATTFLGEDSEPEPDLALRVLPGFGGQSSTSVDDYVAGPPEFIVEIAEADKSIELGDKRRDYNAPKLDASGFMG